MAERLSIRLDARDRAALEAESRHQGKGLSTYLRELAEAEAEARRVRRAAIRAEGDRVMSYLAAQPGARAEVEDIGTPQSDLP